MSMADSVLDRRPLSQRRLRTIVNGGSVPSCVPSRRKRERLSGEDHPLERAESPTRSYLGDMMPSVDTSRPVASLGSAVALAAAIGAVGGLLAGILLEGTDPRDPWSVAAVVLFLTCLCSLAASAAAWIVCLAMNRWRLKRVIGVLAMAALTYVCAVLILPALYAAVNVPNVLNGGALPCIQSGGGCEAGRHGLDAIAGLVLTTLQTYGLCIYAVLGIPMATAQLLVPAAIWDIVARRCGWLRSVEPAPTRRSNAA